MNLFYFWLKALGFLGEAPVGIAFDWKLGGHWPDTNNHITYLKIWQQCFFSRGKQSTLLKSEIHVTCKGKKNDDALFPPQDQVKGEFNPAISNS